MPGHVSLPFQGTKNSENVEKHGGARLSYLFPVHVKQAFACFGRGRFRGPAYGRQLPARRRGIGPLYGQAAVIVSRLMIDAHTPGGCRHWRLYQQLMKLGLQRRALHQTLDSAPIVAPNNPFGRNVPVAAAVIAEVTLTRTQRFGACAQGDQH